MITIAICDDNNDFSYLLFEKIKDIIGNNPSNTAEYEVLSPFNSGFCLLESKNIFNIDILFLDIDMPEIGGFELAEKFKEANRNPLIVFVSNFDNLVYSSFKYTPFGFVRKSNLDFDLTQTMERLFTQFAKNNNTVTLYTKDGTYKVKTEEIMYVESLRNYYLVKDSSNNTYKCRGTISSIGKELVGPYFSVVHHAYIVNIKSVSAFFDKEECVDMNDGKRIYISKRNLADFKKHYLDYLREGIL